MGVGPDFIDVMGLNLVAGRGPSDEVASAAAANPGPPAARIREIVVNEALVRALHWEEAVGKQFELGQGPAAAKGTVVGVVKDFNFRSVHEGVAPFAIYRQVENFSQLPPALRMHEERTMVLNIAGTDVRATLAFVGDTMRKFDPLHPFEFEFVDDSLERLYVADQRLTRLIAIFAGLCIFIACLGLFGLASFMAAQRTREIGVRKVFGARTGQIITLLAHRIVYLVLARGRRRERALLPRDESVAPELRVPHWYQPADLRRGGSRGPLIAYVTVALQSMKVARAHPVNSLRYE